MGVQVPPRAPNLTLPVKLRDKKLMQNQYLIKYINEGFKQVTGFCALSTLQIIDYLDLAEPKSGGALEIGIH